MQESSTVYVGLDVHAANFDIAVADAGRNGEVRHVGTVGGDLVALDKALRKIVDKAIACRWSKRPGRAGS